MNGIGVVGVARIDEMDEQTRALDMAEKTDPESRSFVGAFDETGQIGNDKRAAEFAAFFSRPAIGVDHAEIGLERGEGIVRDFRPGRGNHRDERRFTGIRKTDKADVSEQFQFKTKMTLFTGVTVLVFARGLMPWLGEILVAPAAAPALRDEHALSRRRQIGDGFSG